MGFLEDLTQQLKKQQPVETVTLERVLKYYEFLKARQWSGSIMFYRGKYMALTNTHGNGVYEGVGETVGQALDDILADFDRPRN